MHARGLLGHVQLRADLAVGRSSATSASTCRSREVSPKPSSSSGSSSSSTASVSSASRARAARPSTSPRSHSAPSRIAIASAATAALRRLRGRRRRHAPRPPATASSPAGSGRPSSSNARAARSKPPGRPARGGPPRRARRAASRTRPGAWRVAAAATRASRSSTRRSAARSASPSPRSRARCAASASTVTPLKATAPPAGGVVGAELIRSRPRSITARAPSRSPSAPAQLGAEDGHRPTNCGSLETRPAPRARPGSRAPPRAASDHGQVQLRRPSVHARVGAGPALGVRQPRLRCPTRRRRSELGELAVEPYIAIGRRPSTASRPSAAIAAPRPSGRGCGACRSS